MFLLDANPGDAVQRRKILETPTNYGSHGINSSIFSNFLYRVAEN